MAKPPTEMTAVEITEPGGPEVLRPARRAVPEPGLGEVLIEVAAAGVNRPDTMQRQGAYPPPPGASDLPGLEVSGHVVANGPGAHRYETGDAVCALTHGGGYAEYCVAPETQTLPVPAGLSVVDAAGLPETCFTVWTNTFERARLRAGERLLVHGGSSGIGTTAIQIASALGVRVFATAGSAEKCAACENLGAERAIDYRNEDFVTVVKEITGGEGVDVVLDIVGGSYLRRNLAALRPEGRLAQIAVQEAAKSQIDLFALMRKRLTIVGSTLRPQSVESKARIAGALEETVWPLIEAGLVRPVIDTRLPLEQAAAAHACMEAGQHIGKILLERTHD
ncbi:MAG: NAD(P)H-quinone oxidoreductase [Rhodospirillales bacterium]|nr:NAD(P)H-quinone oxidoreductase [Rhodospirillales bacterium]